MQKFKDALREEQKRLKEIIAKANKVNCVKKINRNLLNKY